MFAMWHAKEIAVHSHRLEQAQAIRLILFSQEPEFPHQQDL
jgi:hypothetical protein